MEFTLISHSLDKSLKLCEHINQVCRASNYLVSQKSLNFNGVSKEQIEELSVLIAISHDFGKSTSFFQEYIQSKKNKTEYKGNALNKSHSLLSAFFGWHMAEKWIIKNTHLDERWKQFIPFAVFLAIEGHHGKYKSIEETLNTIDKNYDLLCNQIRHVIPEIFLYEFYGTKLSEGNDFSIDVINSIASKFRKLNRTYTKEEIDYQIEQRILALFLYSILLEADKAYLASDNPEQYERETIDIPDNLVDEHLIKFKNLKSIDEERNKAYNDTIANVFTFPLTDRIHSITLPTGLGKTLLSISWALKLRNRIRNENGFSPKIIVSLPFLSIIEQTDTIYRDILGGMYNKHKDRLYMPRYSIANFEYKDGLDNEERSDNSVDFFLNIWNSEIIVTTFDQLLYSIFSLKSKHLMRFHNLFNSIIIFDEIQALPSDLWKPFEYFFRKLSEVGDSHIILMSATQPRFIPNAIERVPNHKTYFENRDRVLLTLKPEIKSIEDFVEYLPHFLNNHSNLSLMIVLNTKDSSKLIYKKIVDMVDENIISEKPVIYLSSLVTPSQRTERILKIKHCIESGNNPIIVTTQCIEAGVDLDVDYIIRDWAPLDSIFQVCGRCNRNGEKKKGLIDVIKLESERSKIYSEMVYDNILLQCTNFSVEGNLKISEENFYSIGSLYFDLVRDKMGQSMQIVEGYAQYTHKYNKKTVNIKEILRDNTHQEQFIVTSLDEKLPTEIESALNIDDRWERRYAMKKLGKRMTANSVNVRFEEWMFCKPDDITIDKIGKFVRILDEQFYDIDHVGLDIDLKNPITGAFFT